MLWEIARWLCALAVFGFFLSCVFDLFRLVDRLFEKATGSVEQDIQILYADEQPTDPNAPPPIIEYAAYRNARQRRG